MLTQPDIADRFAQVVDRFRHRDMTATKTLAEMEIEVAEALGAQSASAIVFPQAGFLRFNVKLRNGSFLGIEAKLRTVTVLA